MIDIARKHPAIFMVITTFAWTWSFWFVAFNLLTEPQGLRLALFLLGGFGPAVGGVLVLRMQGDQIRIGPPKIGGFLVGAGLALAALALFYFDVLGVTTSTGPSKVTGILEFPTDSPAYVYILMALVVVVSGYIFASPRSRNERLSAYFAGLVPNRRTLLLAIPVFLFFSGPADGWKRDCQVAWQRLCRAPVRSNACIGLVARHDYQTIYGRDADGW